MVVRGIAVNHTDTWFRGPAWKAVPRGASAVNFTDTLRHDQNPKKRGDTWVARVAARKNVWPLCKIYRHMRVARGFGLW
jgi:hypothetical protein